jgi:hypothetical protein
MAVAVGAVGWSLLLFGFWQRRCITRFSSFSFETVVNVLTGSSAAFQMWSSMEEMSASIVQVLP